MNTSDVLNLIRDECATAGNQAALAKLIGTHKSTITNVLKGSRPPTEKVLKYLRLKRVVEVRYERL